MLKTQNLPKLQLLPSGKYKLWQGKGRVLKQHFYPSKIRLIQWALNLKPGDYFASCFGCNRKVKSISPWWTNEGSWARLRANKRWFIDEVIITDTRGYQHYAPGGGCTLPAETPEAVREYNISLVKERLQYLQNGAVPWIDNELRRMKKNMKQIDEGHPICDEFGEYLPDWNLLK